MTVGLAILLLLLPFVAGELVSRQRSSERAAVASLVLMGGMAAVGTAFSGDAPIPAGPPLVALLCGAAVLSRPPAWRRPGELGHLVQTALWVGIAFGTPDRALVVAAWLLSFVPGLRLREQADVSRRPLALKALLGGVPVVAAVGLHLGGHSDWAYPLVLLGASVRMGVLPFSPLLMASYDKLPLGRAAFVAAVRPSVPLILAVRALAPDQIVPWSTPLQTWAAIAAVLVALQGLAQRDPRRSLGAMSATQSAIILYGLAAPGIAGVHGALVQWAGIGLSLVGLGLLVEAAESRLGRTRTQTVRGLLGPAPGMALLFLLFAATVSGFPGTSGFAGEDLIMQAPARHAVVLRALLLFATALNGVTMLMLFARTFLGPLDKEARGFPPLSIRERLAVGGLIVVLIALSTAPQIVAPSGSLDLPHLVRASVPDVADR